jgi:hypothetical protein
MTKFFVTGDRSVDPMTSLLMLTSGLEQAGFVSGQDSVATGTVEHGIERAARYLGADTYTAGTESDGRTNWDVRHVQVVSDFDKVLFVHLDPTSSTIGKSLAALVPDEQLIISLF